MYVIQTRIHLLQFYNVNEKHVNISHGVKILQQLTNEECQLTIRTTLCPSEELSLEKLTEISFITV
jgi:hypothetical protein